MKKYNPLAYRNLWPYTTEEDDSHINEIDITTSAFDKFKE